jgi:hypothetical protein
MEYGIFNLMGSRDPEKPTVEVFAEVAEQTRLADELGYAIAWFAEHHFSNYCLCASPLMVVAHCAAITKRIRLGTAVVVLPLYGGRRPSRGPSTWTAMLPAPGMSSGKCGGTTIFCCPAKLLRMSPLVDGQSAVSTLRKWGQRRRVATGIRATALLAERASSTW